MEVLKIIFSEELMQDFIKLLTILNLQLLGFYFSSLDSRLTHHCKHYAKVAIEAWTSEMGNMSMVLKHVNNAWKTLLQAVDPWMQYDNIWGLGL